MWPLEFIIPGTPKSQQSSSKGLNQWKQTVRNAASKNWSAAQPVTGTVAVSITFLFDRFTNSGHEPDVDNVAKPIVDALKNLVYADDSAVTDLLCRKRYLNGNLLIRNISPILSQTLGTNAEFVYVVVDDAPLREVNL